MKKLLLFCLAALLLLPLAACKKAAAPEVTSEPETVIPPAADAVSEQDTEPGPESAQDDTILAVPDPSFSPETPPLAEQVKPVELRIPGEWYAVSRGVLLKLLLAEDGSYILTISGSSVAPTIGLWKTDGISLYLDSTASDPLFVLDDRIVWDSAGITFTREQPEVYSPDEAFAEVKSGDLDGLWQSRYITSDGLTVYSEAMNDDTCLYIEGENVALGGSFFGNLPLVFSFEGGAMRAEAGEGEKAVTLTIQLQKDGFLRLGVTSAGGQTVVFYLTPQTPANTEIP